MRQSAHPSDFAAVMRRSGYASARLAGLQDGAPLARPARRRVGPASLCFGAANAVGDLADGSARVSFAPATSSFLVQTKPQGVPEVLVWRPRQRMVLTSSPLPQSPTTAIALLAERLLAGSSDLSSAYRAYLLTPQRDLLLTCADELMLILEQELDSKAIAWMYHAQGDRDSDSLNLDQPALGLTSLLTSAARLAAFERSGDLSSALFAKL
jgi:hypothetical protein